MLHPRTFNSVMNAARLEARGLMYSALADRMERWDGRSVRPNTIEHAIYLGYVIESYRVFGTWLLETVEVQHGSH